jgi:hypothetical protein
MNADRTAREVAIHDWPQDGPVQAAIAFKAAYGWEEAREFARSVIARLSGVHGLPGNAVDVALALQSAIGGRVIDGVDLFWIIAEWQSMGHSVRSARGGSRTKLEEHEEAALKRVLAKVESEEPNPRLRTTAAVALLEREGKKLARTTVAKRRKKK